MPGRQRLLTGQSRQCLASPALQSLARPADWRSVRRLRHVYYLGLIHCMAVLHTLKDSYARTKGRGD